VRISSYPTGAGLGMARQEEDCRELCQRLGWPVFQMYRDNDVSAYSGRPRPAWRQLLADIDAGLADAVVCWHVDRLTRSPRELEEVIDLHDKRGIALATVTGELDLSTPTGRMLARMLGAAARHEAEHKAERHRRAGLQKARAGKPHRAGNRRSYGYQPDGITVIADEACIIAEAAARALAGESMRSIAADLNDRAVPTVTGAAGPATRRGRSSPPAGSPAAASATATSPTASPGPPSSRRTGPTSCGSCWPAGPVPPAPAPAITCCPASSPAAGAGTACTPALSPAGPPGTCASRNQASLGAAPSWSPPAVPTTKSATASSPP
jgi:site-specific DNA recombinase